MAEYVATAIELLGKTAEFIGKLVTFKSGMLELSGHVAAVTALFNVVKRDGVLEKHLTNEQINGAIIKPLKGLNATLKNISDAASERDRRWEWFKHIMKSLVMDPVKTWREQILFVEQLLQTISSVQSIEAAAGKGAGEKKLNNEQFQKIMRAAEQRNALALAAKRPVGGADAAAAAAAAGGAAGAAGAAGGGANASSSLSDDPKLMLEFASELIQHALDSMQTKAAQKGKDEKEAATGSVDKADVFVSHVWTYTGNPACPFTWKVAISGTDMSAGKPLTVPPKLKRAIVVLDSNSGVRANLLLADAKSAEWTVASSGWTRFLVRIIFHTDDGKIYGRAYPLNLGDGHEGKWNNTIAYELSAECVGADVIAQVWGLDPNTGAVVDAAKDAKAESYSLSVGDTMLNNKAVPKAAADDKKQADGAAAAAR